MKSYINLLLLSFLLIGCTYESQHPQESFSFSSTNDDIIKARILLHKISINNNLSFSDQTHKYPSNKLIVIATAERADGLKIIMSGSSDLKDISVFIHCHNKCNKWSNIYNVTKKEFSKHWQLVYDTNA